MPDTQAAFDFVCFPVVRCEPCGGDRPYHNGQCLACGTASQEETSDA